MRKYSLLYTSSVCVRDGHICNEIFVFSSGPDFLLRGRTRQKDVCYDKISISFVELEPVSSRVLVCIQSCWLSC